MSPTETTTYSIASVHDASCSGDSSGVVTIRILRQPAVVRGPDDAVVRPGTSTTLSVTTTGDLLSFQWYQGASGDVSTLVGTNSVRFDTPPIDRPMSYWVRVSNACGSVSSSSATVSPSRGRAARH